MADRTGTLQAPLAHGNEQEHRRQIAQRSNQCLPKSGSEPMLGDLDMGGNDIQNAGNMAMEKISAGTVTNSASLDIIGLSSSYRAYELIFDDLLAATDGANLILRVSTDNGANFISTTNYQYANMSMAVTGSIAGAAATVQAQMLLDSGVGDDLNTGDKVSGTLRLTQFAVGGTPNVHYVSAKRNSSGNFIIRHTAAQYDTNGNINAIRLFFSSGNIKTMNYTLYGITA